MLALRSTAGVHQIFWRLSYLFSTSSFIGRITGSYQSQHVTYMTDPIADMLTRIRNAQAIKAATVAVPHSKLKEAIVKTLIAEGYIASYKVEPGAQAKNMIITLKYQGPIPAITTIKRISKPGRRLYARANALTTPLSGYGITIISTSQGVMTNKQAQVAKVGGELVCQVW